MPREPPKQDLPSVHPRELLREDRPETDHSFATADLSDERAQAIGSSRMDERHAHLDALLESKEPKRRYRRSKDLGDVP